jgi:chromosome segregation ATPase
MNESAKEMLLQETLKNLKKQIGDLSMALAEASAKVTILDSMLNGLQKENEEIKSKLPSAK